MLKLSKCFISWRLRSLNAHFIDPLTIIYCIIKWTGIILWSLNKIMLNFVCCVLIIVIAGDNCRGGVFQYLICVVKQVATLDLYTGNWKVFRFNNTVIKLKFIIYYIVLSVCKLLQAQLTGMDKLCWLYFIIAISLLSLNLISYFLVLIKSHQSHRKGTFKRRKQTCTF